MKRISVLLAMILLCPPLLAEDVEPRTKYPSNALRLRGASSVVPVPWGYVGLGGSRLRHLPEGAKEWVTLHQIPEKNLYRISAHVSGKLLASWENDDFLHLFLIQEKKHIPFPKPKAPPEFRGWSLDDIYFEEKGTHAIVYMHGLTHGWNGWTTAAFRVKADGSAPPVFLFQQTGHLLCNTRHQALFAYPKDLSIHCSEVSCQYIAGVVGYEIRGDKAVKRTFFTTTTDDYSIAKPIWARNGDEVAVALHNHKTGRQLLRWKLGEDKAVFHPLPKGPRWAPERAWIAGNGDLVQAWYTDDFGILLERRTRTGATTSVEFPRNKKEDWDTTPYAIKERKNGDVFMHLGNRFFLLPRKGPIKVLRADHLLKRGNEWGGAAIYDPEPEAFWIGIDIPGGRDYVYMTLEEIEKKAKFWK